MNEYRITYVTAGGDTGHVDIVERTEVKARAAFNASVRGAYKSDEMPMIQGIEFLRSNAPATKQQERDALKVIRNMVEELGPNSYLATAFRGCFDDAEENIENDFAFSYYDRWQESEHRADTLAAEAAELKHKLAESEKDYEAAHAAAKEVAEQKDAEVQELKADLEKARADVDAEHKLRLEERSGWMDARKNGEKLEAELHERDMTILELKAKLYDFMSASKQ